MLGFLVGNDKELDGNNWADMILNGDVTLYIDKRIPRLLSRIAIIDKNTDLILGTVEIDACTRIKDAEHWERLKPKHKQTCNFEDFKDSTVYGWQLYNPIRLKTPVPCKNRILRCGDWIKNAIDDLDL